MPLTGCVYLAEDGSQPPLDRSQHVGTPSVLPRAGTALSRHSAADVDAAIAAHDADIRRRCPFRHPTEQFPSTEYTSGLAWKPTWGVDSPNFIWFCCMKMEPD